MTKTKTQPKAANTAATRKPAIRRPGETIPIREHREAGEPLGPVVFWITPALAARIEANARRAGVTANDYMEGAIRQGMREDASMP
ncbi:MAG: hypothetical protein WCP45_18300 [Verrucomicrobiota bacterium]